MDTLQFIYSPVDRHLDCFQFGAIMNKAAMHRSLCGHMLLE